MVRCNKPSGKRWRPIEVKRVMLHEYYLFTAARALSCASWTASMSLYAT